MDLHAPKAPLDGEPWIKKEPPVGAALLGWVIW